MIWKLSIILFSLCSIIFGQDFSGIRIYINPGHGGTDPANDRFIPETGFWESEGNLTKGLYLRDILSSLNATTKMSRTTNNASDDLGLSVISADANNFDADYFQSIHSNATGISTKRNTTLILFRGYDNDPVFPASKEMANLLVNEIYKAHRTTGKSVRGDWDFYNWGTQGLGVLRGLQMPGTLSEGSFHDYIPESFRLKNDVYLKHESWAITKAFIDYFELTDLPYGEIAGIITDEDESVDYYYLPGTRDRKKPLNFVKAVLMPDSIVYEGDDFNNGFYLFDQVAPGTYDVILEAENYERDTVLSVSVTANNTVFVDKSLFPKPDYSVPIITSFTPSETEKVRLDTDIILEFSVKMDRVSVEQSFLITPNVLGSFKWEDNDKTMIFSPNDYLEAGTNYQIILNGFAKSIFDVFIGQQFSHSFLSRSSLSLVKSYPDQNSTDISTTVKIILEFDAPIYSNSLGGHVFLEDLNGNNINPFIDEFDYQNGRIIFEPLTTLKHNSFYQIRLLNGIKDTEGSQFNSDTLIVFKTGPTIIPEGSTITDFEEDGIWWQPVTSGSTRGIDPAKTSFSISNKKSIAGDKSGRLIYSFSDDSLGICRIYNPNQPNIGSSQNSIFGMWVFGDHSYNNLEYWFRNSEGTNIPIFIDTLNWTGWKFKEIDLSSYSNLDFHSMVIIQNPAGRKSGQIYFDTILSDVITGVNVNHSDMSTEFVLHQNYPNPFNPSTVISYRIPSAVDALSGVEGQNIQLVIYDVLGREVSTLVNENQTPGNYEVIFDGSNLSSGIYYYQLDIGSQVSSKKMILLK